MANFPGPHQVRIFYTADADSLVRTHQMNLNCVIDGDDTPGDGFDGYMVARRASASDPLNAVLDAWIALLQPCFGADVTFTHAELWGYEVGTNNAHFISAYTIAEVGTHISVPVNDSEVIITFRTIGGGSMRIHFMEASHAVGATDSPPFAVAHFEAIRSFVISTANWIYARDNSYPFAAVGLYPGINEALFKDRYR